MTAADDAELAREFDRLDREYGEAQVKKMVAKRYRFGAPEKNENDALALMVELFVLQGGKKRKTAARLVLKDFGLPSEDTDCDRLRNLSKQRSRKGRFLLADGWAVAAKHDDPSVPEHTWLGEIGPGFKF